MYRVPSSFLPPPSWIPFSSMLYMFSGGTSKTCNKSPSSRKCRLTTTGLKLRARTASRPVGRLNTNCGFRTRNVYTQFLDGNCFCPVLLVFSRRHSLRSATCARRACFERGSPISARCMIHSHRACSCASLFHLVLWVFWACVGGAGDAGWH